MSYQVLARKYRPASFQELEGQEHVLQALINALDNQRLHHAYLFTGTRGVGKTTIARILARCLNCQNDVTSKPCGECSTCVEISEGRSVDLIEVDAASRTGVDDMRDLLDNVQYMPTASRFKIYLIDEVHMLSRNSFNAMLKTLEEPPEHVKFLFATTDPKKLPITVLSRCLQFNLRNLSPEQIVRHLGEVLQKESIAYDESALWHVGHAADGSMRDALSLTDQAISFGNNEVREASVRSMLGSIDQQEVHGLLDAIISEDGEKLLAKIAGLSEFAPDYAALLDDLLAMLHRIAIAQAVPGAVDNAQGDKELMLAAAGRLSAEQVQLLYQIGLIGQRDLPLAPMPRMGFEMVLLRMMAFSPTEPGIESEPVQSPRTGLLSAVSGDGREAGAADPKQSASKQAGLKRAESRPEPKQDEPKQAESGRKPETPPTAISETPLATPPETPPPAPSAAPPLESANWAKILEAMNIDGITGMLAAHCQLVQAGDDECLLKLAEQHVSLWNTTHEQRIARALSSLYGREMSVTVEVGIIDAETPAQHKERKKEEDQAEAIADIENDERVKRLIEAFNGRLDPESITPLGYSGK